MRKHSLSRLVKTETEIRKKKDEEEENRFEPIPKRNR